MKLNCSYFLLLLIFLSGALLKASDPIPLKGSETLQSGLIPEIEAVLVRDQVLLNSQSDLELMGAFLIGESRYEIKSLRICQNSTIFMRFKDFFVLENILVEGGRIQLQTGILRCGGEIKLESKVPLIAQQLTEGGRILEIILNREAQIIAKSLNLISTKTNFPIIFNFFSQKTVRQYLSKPKPLIEIENLIKSTSMIDLWIQAGPNVYYSAGKYPLIKASKIDREKFNLCFLVGTDGMDLTQEQKGFFHLEFDDTTVWLVIDQDAVAP